jgi:hypothetical protein
VLPPFVLKYVIPIHTHIVATNKIMAHTDPNAIPNAFISNFVSVSSFVTLLVFLILLSKYGFERLGIEKSDQAN